jgi:hypothetical protein
MTQPPLSQLGNYWRSLSSAKPPLFTPRTMNRGALSQSNLTDPSAAIFGLAPQPLYWKPTPGMTTTPGLPPLSDPNVGGREGGMGAGEGGPGGSAPGDASGTGAGATSPAGISVDPATGIASPNTASVPGAVSAAISATVSPAAAAAMNAAMNVANTANTNAANAANAATNAPAANAAVSADVDAAAAAAAANSSDAVNAAVAADAAAAAGDSGVGSATGSSAADAPAGIGGIGGVGDDGSADGGGGGGGGGGGCFLTEAIMSAGGKDDNAEELQVMRAFRDDYLLPNPQYEPLVREYYAIAPLVVKALNRRPDAQKIYQFIDKRFIQPAVRMVLEGDIEPAFQHYADMIEFVTPFAEEAEPRREERAAIEELGQGAEMASEIPRGGALSMIGS